LRADESGLVIRRRGGEDSKEVGGGKLVDEGARLRVEVKSDLEATRDRVRLVLENGGVAEKENRKNGVVSFEKRFWRAREV
jgi:hypothetical protein